MHGERSLRAFLWSICIVLTLSCHCLADPFDSLLARIPPHANSLMLIHVDSVFRSPVAVANKWRETYTDRFAAAPLLVPPKAEYFLVASELDIESLKPRWESAAMQLSIDPTIEEIGGRLGGSIDEIQGVPVVWPRNGLCIAKFAGRQFGILMPADRQSAARWLSQATGRASSDLSPYLQSAARYARGAGPEIILALDLNHMLYPDSLQESVRQSKVLQGLEQEAVVQVLASIQGIMCGVRVDQALAGRLVLDFGRDASILQPVAKELILGVLENAGATIDDLHEWNAEVRGKRITLSGPLSTDGLRRLFSLVSLDASIMAPTEEPATPDNASTPDKTKVASSRYYRAIQRYLADLQRPSRYKQNLQQQALWLRNYARRIDQIRASHVDPDLAEYGAFVARSLRDAVERIYGISDRTRERTLKIRPQSEAVVAAIPRGLPVNYGNEYYTQEYSPFAMRRIDTGAIAEARSVEEEELQAGINDAQKIMDEINYQSQQILSTMQQRYGEDFGG